MYFIKNNSVIVTLNPPEKISKLANLNCHKEILTFVFKFHLILHIQHLKINISVSFTLCNQCNKKESLDLRKNTNLTKDILNRGFYCRKLGKPYIYKKLFFL